MAAMIVSCERLSGAAAQDQQPSVTLPPDLARVLEDYRSAWMKKDSQALANLFTEDGFVLSPGSPILRGRQVIAKHYSNAGGPLFLRAVAFSTNGNIGYILGAFADKPESPDRGKFTLTLRRDATGRWMIVSDMDNGNIRLPDCRPASQ
jgi:ketosteroid isomerase-like protein